MKDFYRYPHDGVLADLEMVKRYFASDPAYSFGSSAEGQLTIQARQRTAYVRKYKNSETWSIALTRDVAPYRLVKFSSVREVLRYLEANLS